MMSYTSFSLTDPPSLRPNDAPERIYGWLDSQLSIARHYGGITYNGHKYVIDYNDPQEPLVRQDPKKGKRK
jgi:hypothetical protein